MQKHRVVTAGKNSGCLTVDRHHVEMEFFFHHNHTKKRAAETQQEELRASVVQVRKQKALPSSFSVNASLPFVALVLFVLFARKHVA
jgi:hypothetical protein